MRSEKLLTLGTELLKLAGSLGGLLLGRSGEVLDRRLIVQDDTGLYRGSGDEESGSST